MGVTVRVPVFAAMPRMLRELRKDPSGGLLNAVALNRKGRKGKGRRYVGLWHETYVVPEGAYESIYADMPAFGLAVATGTLPLEGRGRSAKERFAHWSGKEVSAWAPCGCWAMAAAG